MYIVGLTGGIGSGKSQVADILQTLGAAVIDTDRISHDLTASKGAAMGAIGRAFGAGAIAPDGALDRAWMRARAFADPAVRQQLESILHPLIRQDLADQLARVRGPYCVLVVPLLLESGAWLGRVDRVCVVDCDPETQIARVQARSGLTRSTIERIMSAQASRGDRLAAADDVLVNDAATDLETLHRRTCDFHRFWCDQAARGAAGRSTHE